MYMSIHMYTQKLSPTYLCVLSFDDNLGSCDFISKVTPCTFISKNSCQIYRILSCNLEEQF